jgi:hypothetical protein
MARNFDRNQHLGEDAAARDMADALDALAAAELAGAPAGLNDRIARASMPGRGAGLRLAGRSSRPWAARMRPVFAMAAAVAVVAGAAIYMSTRPTTAPEPIANNNTVAPAIATGNGTGNANGATPAPVKEDVPQLAIAKASSDVETWLAVGEEMDAMLSTTVADLTASASALEERASTAFAADDWYSESSL